MLRIMRRNEDETVCDNTSCMKNVGGRCGHRSCPIKNPDYHTPPEQQRILKEKIILDTEQRRAAIHEARKEGKPMPVVHEPKNPVHKPYTTEEEERIKDMYYSNCSHQEIANEMGRTLYGIHVKITTLIKHGKMEKRERVKKQIPQKHEKD